MAVAAAELTRFLLIRGFWLILIDFTLIKFGWRFDLDLYRFTAGVIFLIGASMIVLAALIWPPMGHCGRNLHVWLLALVLLYHLPLVR
jgi:uncharacterized membrane protein